LVISGKEFQYPCRSKKVNIREKLLGKWSLWAFRNSGKALLFVLLVTFLPGTGFARLFMEMIFYSAPQLIPDEKYQIYDRGIPFCLPDNDCG